MADLFTLSFRPDIELELVAEQITLRSSQQSLTLTHPKPGLKAVLDHLKHSAFTLIQLIAVVAELDGAEDGIAFEAELQKLIHLGWICHAVLPLAIAIPIAEDYQFNAPRIDWHQQPLTLSRFAFLHQDNHQFILESPLSKAKIALLNWQATAIIAQLTQPNSVFTPEKFAELPIAHDALEAFIQLLIATEMITIEPEATAIAQWKFHNLLFHRQTRLERLETKPKALPYFEDGDRYPIVKPAMSDRVIALAKPDLIALAQTDISLTQAIETRQSIREYDDQPMTLAQLAEFLYRCARVKDVYTLEEDPMNIGEWTKRPYPSGGGLYELEIYPIINRCTGLDSGLYHYQPLSHTLQHIADYSSEVESLVFDAWNATGQQDVPQVIFIITARFGRLFWKYHDIAYGLILKHVGVLYQTFYLVATAMQLAPSAIGAGKSKQFCRVANLNEYEESSVGEFSLGSLKHHSELGCTAVAEESIGTNFGSRNGMIHPCRLNPNQRHPIPALPRICFIKNCITAPNIIVGDYSYYDDPVDSERFEHNVLYHIGSDRLIIGKFCAVAAGVKFIMNGANHKLDGISTYPFPIFGNGWESTMDQLINLPSRGDTVIGNDVWFGYESTIMPGVKIGDGAIIAAKSVVVKDVPPYTTVGGNPATVIRQRFSDAEIAKLLEISWWDWEIEKITQSLPLIMSNQIEVLYALCS